MIISIKAREAFAAKYGQEWEKADFQTVKGSKPPRLEGLLGRWWIPGQGKIQPSDIEVWPLGDVEGNIVVGDEPYCNGVAPLYVLADEALVAARARIERANALIKKIERAKANREETERISHLAADGYTYGANPYDPDSW